MPDSQVEAVKAKIDIVSYIGEKVALKKSGRNFKGLCPFHGEKTPSFFVSSDMQYYKCFGCGVAGDVFTFVMSFDGLTFAETLEQLAERAGITLTKSTTSSGDQRRKIISEMLYSTTEYYHYLLTQHQVGRIALAYLKQRGITQQSIRDFRIGYSLNSWDGLQQYLIDKKHYTTDDLLAAGLIIKSDRGSYYDRFRGRLMFPQYSYAGKVVGFSGRTLEHEVKEAKYINSPETDYYHKSEILFGLNLAKKAIRDKKRIILVEGELDVVSSHQVGLTETVAVKGSAITAEQAGLIRRLTYNVIVALDADAAGQDAIHRGIAVCEAQALNLRVAQLSGGKDPDEIAKKDPALLKQTINNADTVYSYLIATALARHDCSTGEGKKMVAQEVMPQLAKIENAVEKEFYINKLSQGLKVSHNALYQELAKAQSKAAGVPQTKGAEVARFEGREMLERQLLGLLLHSESPQLDIQQTDEAWFSETHLKRLFHHLSCGATSIHHKGIDLVKNLPEPLQPLAHEIYTMKAEWLELTQEEIARVLLETKLRLEHLWAKQRLVEITKQLASLPTDSEELVALQAEYARVAGVNKRAEAGREQRGSV